MLNVDPRPPVFVRVSVDERVWTEWIIRLQVGRTLKQMPWSDKCHMHAARCCTISKLTPMPVSGLLHPAPRLFDPRTGSSTFCCRCADLCSVYDHSRTVLKPDPAATTSKTLVHQRLHRRPQLVPVCTHLSAAALCQSLLLWCPSKHGSCHTWFSGQRSGCDGVHAGSTLSRGHQGKPGVVNSARQ